MGTNLRRVHRRTLLAAIGSATVGAGVAHAQRSAALRSGGQACELAVRDVGVRYHPAVPDSPQVAAEITLDPGSCEGDVVVSVRAGGTEWARERLAVGSDVDTHYVSRSQPDFPQEIDAATVRISTPDGTTLAERTVEVADYREQPGRFEVVCASLDRRSVQVGEPVRATVTVGNDGYAPEYEARLLVGDGAEVVDRVRDRTHGIGSDDPDDPGCPGQEVTLSHAFDEPGEYPLRVHLVPTGEGGTGDTHSLGTVTVGDGWPREPLAIAGLLGGGALGAWWHRTRG